MLAGTLNSTPFWMDFHLQKDKSKQIHQFCQWYFCLFDFWVAKTLSAQWIETIITRPFLLSGYCHCLLIDIWGLIGCVVPNYFFSSDVVNPLPAVLFLCPGYGPLRCFELITFFHIHKSIQFSCKENNMQFLVKKKKIIIVTTSIFLRGGAHLECVW